jgi:hypothetical protein
MGRSEERFFLLVVPFHRITMSFLAWQEAEKDIFIFRTMAFYAGDTGK